MAPISSLARWRLLRFSCHEDLLRQRGKTDKLMTTCGNAAYMGAMNILWRKAFHPRLPYSCKGLEPELVDTTSGYGRMKDSQQQACACEGDKLAPNRSHKQRRNNRKASCRLQIPGDWSTLVVNYIYAPHDKYANHPHPQSRLMLLIFIYGRDPFSQSSKTKFQVDVTSTRVVAHSRVRSGMVSRATTITSQVTIMGWSLRAIWCTPLWLVKAVNCCFSSEEADFLPNFLEFYCSPLRRLDRFIEHVQLICGITTTPTGVPDIPSRSSAHCGATSPWCSTRWTLPSVPIFLQRQLLLVRLNLENVFWTSSVDAGGALPSPTQLQLWSFAFQHPSLRSTRHTSSTQRRQVHVRGQPASDKV